MRGRSSPAQPHQQGHGGLAVQQLLRLLHAPPHNLQEARRGIP